jgi:uncharacterized membrane protein
MAAWIDSMGTDVAALAASAAMVALYYLFLLRHARRDPHYTIHGVNDTARTRWVEYVMANPTRDVMAVQTLRNFTMSATFMASSAALLILGTLTLTGQGETLARTWHAVSVGGSSSPEIWIVKIMVLLCAFIAAFFAFTWTVRLLNHVVFMINVPDAAAYPGMGPRHVAHRLVRAGHFYSLGIRAFLAAVPLAFWLFGPLYLVAATIGLIVILHYVERSPHIGDD